MAPPPSTASTLQLFKSLCPTPWTLPYAALIDPTGVFRKQLPNVPRDLATHLIDICCELRLAGRATEADRVEELCVPDALGDEAALLVVLLCARRLREKHSNINCFIAEQWHGSLRRNAQPWEESEKGVTGPFSEPIGSDELGGKLPPQRSVHTNDNTPHDCIAGAARFALEQSRFWFKARQADGVEVMKIAEGDIGFEGVVGADARFVEWAVGSDTSVSSCTHDFLASRPADDENRAMSTPGVDGLVRFLLVKCLCGDSPDLQTCSEREERPKSRLGRAVCEHWDELSDECRQALLSREFVVAARKSADNTFVSLAHPANEITDAIRRAVLCGQIYLDVATFAQAFVHVRLGRSLSAVVSFANKRCHDYFSSIHAAAHGKHLLGSNRPWALLDSAESCICDLSMIAEVACELEQTDGSACAVIDTISRAEERYAGNQTVRLLLECTLKPYLQIIWDWVFDGSSLRDVTQEFFGSRLGLSVTGSEDLCTAEQENSRPFRDAAVYPSFLDREHSLFILRAGRTRVLLKSCLPDLPMLSRKPPELLVNNGGPGIYDLCRSLDLFSEEVMSLFIALDTSPLSSPGAEPFDHDLDNSNCSEHGSGRSINEVASDLMADGKAENACERAGRVCFPVPIESEPIGDTKNEDPTTLFTSSALQDRDMQSDTLSRYPEQSTETHIAAAVLYQDAILKPLMKVDKAIQQEALRFFVDELNVFVHFNNLRLHVLLGAGDFADVLVEQIESASSLSQEDENYIQRRANAAMTFYGTSGPGMRSTRFRAHLNRCLITSLNLSTLEYNEYAARLSLDTAAYQDPQKSSLWDAEMDFKYDVQFPLTMIFSAETMGMYSKIFDFMIRTLRAKKSLRSLFMISRRNSVLRYRAPGRAMSNRQLQALLWLFCCQAEHFVSIFGGFEMDQVLGTRWTEFERSWTRAKSIWELRDLHRNYLSDCIRRCLLGEKHRSVLGVMNGGFEIVVKIDKEMSVISAPDAYVSESKLKDTRDLLRSASASLRRRVTFLTDVLDRLLEGGTHSHLKDLLTRLRLNNYYDYTRK